MPSQEYPLNTDISSIPIDLFSAEERERLARMRDGYHHHTEYLERVIDERRLEFARWLAENGRLSEAA
jgi:hypothetical protein